MKVIDFRRVPGFASSTWEVMAHSRRVAAGQFGSDETAALVVSDGELPGVIRECFVAGVEVRFPVSDSGVVLHDPD